MRAPSTPASLMRRLPLVLVLILAACLCLATASPSTTTDLAPSSAGSADSNPFVGEDAIPVRSNGGGGGGIGGIDSDEGSTAQEVPTSEDAVTITDGDASYATGVVVDAEAASNGADVTAAAVTTTPTADTAGSTHGKDVAVNSTSSSASRETATDADVDEREEKMVLTPIPTAAVDSSTFALVDSVACDSETVDTIESICSINRAMFDACVAKSGYQIFPYSGVVPDADDITSLVTSESCMGFITAVVLLNMPACTVAQLPLRAVCETLLKISVDVEKGEAAPSAEEFHAEMVWRRDSDLAKQAGEPYDNASAIYADFTRNLRVALTESKVTVLSNLTILIEDYEGEEIDMADGAEAAFDMSLDDESGLGTVEAADSDDEVDTAAVSEESSISGSGYTSVSTLSSDAQHIINNPVVVVVVALAVVVHALV